MRGPSSRTRSASTGRGWDSALADLAHELAHEKGVALGRGEARVHEGLVGVVARLFAQQRLERGSAERRRPHEPGARVSEQLLEQLLLDLLGTGSARHGERHRQVLHAAGEVGEEGQRGRIGPVRVIDQHEQRGPVREAGAQPVEPVQHGERALVLLTVSTELEDGRAQRRGAVHELVGAGTVDARLEQLPHHAEGELALELGAACAQHAHAALACLALGRQQQLRLADPAGPLDDERRARARASGVEALEDLAQLAVAVEQPRTRRCRPAHVPQGTSRPAAGGGPL